MEWSDRIGRRIRLRDLHILLAVVQCKSMGKAAEHLAVSKPVVSKAIADLEAVLGVRLLDRDRHGAEPTMYGAALLKRGATVFGELRESVKDIEFLADPNAGEVRIGSPAPIAASFVPAVIDQLSRRYPRIVFHVVATEETYYRELRERNLDLLIVRRYAPRARDELDFEVLYDDPFVVATSAQSPWARRRKVTLAELADELWVLPPPEHVIGTVAMEAFRASGLDYPRVTVVAVPRDVRLGVLASGRFLTILPRSALRFPTRHPLIKELPVELPGAGPIGMVTVKNRVLSPVVQRFVNCAREVAKPLARRK